MLTTSAERVIRLFGLLEAYVPEFKAMVEKAERLHAEQQAAAHPIRKRTRFTFHGPTRKEGDNPLPVARTVVRLRNGTFHTFDAPPIGEPSPVPLEDVVWTCSVGRDEVDEGLAKELRKAGYTVTEETIEEFV